jgi:ubiquinone/menaquinone biosynthesis C-methylase UbiE
LPLAGTRAGAGDSAQQGRRQPRPGASPEESGRPDKELLDSGLEGDTLRYMIDESDPERQQLLDAGLERATRELIELIDLRPGSRCLDIGCGAGGATRVLGEAAGPTGECVGLDADPNLLGIADTKHSEDASIRYVRGDAAKLPFDDNVFDLTHARYLLAHVPNPADVVSEMVRVTKSGGVVAVYEPEITSISCYPESWAYDALPEFFAKAYADSRVGRKVVALLKAAGCNTVKAQARIGIDHHGTYFKHLYRMTFDATARRLIDAGDMSESECKRMAEELRRVEEDGATIIIGSPSILAWGIV